MTTSPDIRVVALDFDGTIMQYENPPEHFHPEVITVLNQLAKSDIAWVANSGRSFESQLEIINHSMDQWGLHHSPDAILHSEIYMHLRNGDGSYASLDPWNQTAREKAHALHRHIQIEHAAPLEDLVKRHGPDSVFLREDGTVFQIRSPEVRSAFLDDMARLFGKVEGLDTIVNGEWIALISEEHGKGNLLRHYLEQRGFTPDHALAIGDHGNDISMLTGHAARYTGCPGNAYDPVKEVVRQAGGHVGKGDGPQGTLDVIQHYLG